MQRMQREAPSSSAAAVSAWLDHSDETAAAWLVRQHMPQVLRLVRSRIKDRWLCDDIVQQVLIKCFRALHRVDREREIGPWMMTIARNTCATVWRSQKNSPMARLEDGVDLEQMKLEDGGAERNTETSRRMVAVLLWRLKKADRRLLWFCYFKNRSAQEAGRMAGISAGNVRVRVHRIQRQAASQCRLMRKGILDL